MFKVFCSRFVYDSTINISDSKGRESAGMLNWPDVIWEKEASQKLHLNKYSKSDCVDAKALYIQWAGSTCVFVVELWVQIITSRKYLIGITGLTLL